MASAPALGHSRSAEGALAIDVTQSDGGPMPRARAGLLLSQSFSSQVTIVFRVRLRTD